MNVAHMQHMSTWEGGNYASREATKAVTSALVTRGYRRTISDIADKDVGCLGDALFQRLLKEES